MTNSLGDNSYRALQWKSSCSAVVAFFLLCSFRNARTTTTKLDDDEVDILRRLLEPLSRPNVGSSSHLQFAGRLQYAWFSQVDCPSGAFEDKSIIFSAYEWTTSPGYGCLGNRATDCTFYFSFCQLGETDRWKSQECWQRASLAPHCHNAYSACENSSLSPNITMIGALTTTIFFADGTVSFSMTPRGPEAIDSISIFKEWTDSTQNFRLVLYKISAIPPVVRHRYWSNFNVT